MQGRRFRGIDAGVTAGRPSGHAPPGGAGGGPRGRRRGVAGAVDTCSFFGSYFEAGILTPRTSVGDCRLRVREPIAPGAELATTARHRPASLTRPASGCSSGVRRSRLGHLPLGAIVLCGRREGHRLSRTWA